MKTNSSLYAVATVGAPPGTKDGKGNPLLERVASRTGEEYAIMDVAGPDRSWTLRMEVQHFADAPTKYTVRAIKKGWREADASPAGAWETVASGEIA